MIEKFIGSILNDTPQNKEKIYMTWIKHILTIGIGWVGIIPYVVVIRFLYPYDKGWALVFFGLAVLWIVAISISYCYGKYLIGKDKSKKEEEEKVRKEKKDVLIEEYKTTIRIFYLWMEDYKDRQVWKSIGLEGNKEPKEVSVVFDRFREFDKMLDNL